VTVQTMRAMRDRQKAREEARLERRMQQCTEGALLIQLAWRGFAARRTVGRMRAEEAAARRLQKNYRAYKQRSQIKLLQFVRGKRDRAAIKVR
jgi:hypothetical protein